MSLKKHCLRIINIILKLKGKNDKLICSRQELLIQVNGLEGLGMDLEYRFGLMGQDTKANGKTIELMVMGGLYTLMVTYMRGTGSMIRQMDLDCMYMLMVLAMKGSGDTIYSTARAKKCGQMAQYMKVNMFKGRNMVMVCTVGMTGQCTMENGRRIKLKDLALIPG